MPPQKARSWPHWLRCNRNCPLKGRIRAALCLPNRPPSISVLTPAPASRLTDCSIRSTGFPYLPSNKFRTALGARSRYNSANAKSHDHPDHRCFDRLRRHWIAQTQQPPAQPLQIEKVKDDLYNISGSGGNVAAYLTNEGVILIDDKFPQNTPEILAKVKSVSDKAVRYVVNTHHHGDHTGGNANLLGSTEIIGHRNNRANIVEKNQPGAQRITFSDEMAVHLGGKEVRAHYFGRGHTNGDVVVYFPAHKTIHTGDLFVGGAPFIDYSSGGSAVDWVKTIDGILQWDFETVIPGHGPVMKREDLIAFRGKIDTLTKRMSEIKRKGTSKADAAKVLNLDDLGWKVAGLFERSVPGLYDEVQ